MSLRKQQNKTYFNDPTKETLFRETFKLPDAEEQDAGAFVVFNIKGHPEGYSGKSYISTHFLVFESIDARSCKFTIPLASVRRVERLPTDDEDIITGGFVLALTCFNGLTLVLHLQSLFKTNEQFCDALRARLRANVSSMKTVKAFCRTLFSEYLMTDNAGGGLARLASNVGLLVDVDSPESSTEWTTRAGVQGDAYHTGLGTIFKYPGDPKKLKEKAKMKLWREYLAAHGRNLTLVRYPALNRLVQVGLPNRLRGEIWELTCGSLYLRLHNPGAYEKILADHAHEKSPSADDIEKDLHRSLPEYPAFQHTLGIDTMRRVLTAYAWSNPELGYCQAMNLIVASFLIYMSEEQCFWCLSVLCDRLLPGYYSPSMYGTVLDQKVFESLVARFLPALHTHFTAVDVQLSVSSLPWFLSLFISAMPMVFAFRIIDCFFLLGPRVLFQVGLAILRINHDALLETEDDGVFINTMKAYFATLDAPAYPNARSARMRAVTRFQELLVIAFRDFAPVTDSLIAAERRRFRADVVVSIESFAKRTALRNLHNTGRLSKDALSLAYDHFQYAFLNAREAQRAQRKVSDNPLAAAATAADAQTELVLDRRAFGRFVSGIATWARDEKLIRNAFHEHIERTPRDHELIDRLFAAWTRTGQDPSASSGSSVEVGTTSPVTLTLQGAVEGLNSVMFNDLMSNLSWIFDLYDGDKDGFLTKDEVLKLSEGLLFMFRNEPGDRYLASVSNLLQNLFEYVAATGVPEVPTAAETQPKGPETAPTATPYLGLSAFRMCVLADELLEQFFDSDLTESWKLEVLIKEAPIPPANRRRLGSTAAWLGGMINSVIDDHKDTINRFADEVGRRLDIQTVEQRPSIGKLDPEAAAQEPQQRSSLFGPGGDATPGQGGDPAVGDLIGDMSGVGSSRVDTSHSTPGDSTSNLASSVPSRVPTPAHSTPINPQKAPTLLGGSTPGSGAHTPHKDAAPESYANPWAIDSDTIDIQAAAERAMARPQFVIDDAEEEDDVEEEDTITDDQLLDQVNTFKEEDSKRDETEQSSQVRPTIPLHKSSDLLF